MKHGIYIFLLFFSCVACTKTTEERSNITTREADTLSNAEIKFDKKKWRAKDDDDYPFREAMLNDLMINENLKGMKRDDAIRLLGEPDKIDTSYLFYRVEQKRLG